MDKNTINLLATFGPWFFSIATILLTYMFSRENSKLTNRRLEHDKSVAFRNKSMEAYSEMYGNITDIRALHKDCQSSVESRNELIIQIYRFQELFRKYSFYISPLHRDYFLIIFRTAGISINMGNGTIQEEQEHPLNPVNPESFAVCRARIMKAYELLSLEVDTVLYPEAIKELNSEKHKRKIANLKELT